LPTATATDKPGQCLDRRRQIAGRRRGGHAKHLPEEVASSHCDCDGLKAIAPRKNINEGGHEFRSISNDTVRVVDWRFLELLSFFYT
jgi:hypothetical protein